MRFCASTNSATNASSGSANVVICKPKPAFCLHSSHLLLPKYYHFVVILLFLPFLLHASISQELIGADSLEVGTPFTFRIKADYAIKAASIPDSLEDFAILSSRQSTTSTSVWEVVIAPMKTGALSFPRLQVQPVLPGIIPEYTDGFRVFVMSVLAEGDSLLKDIKPMQRYPLQPPFWVYLLLLVLVMALAIYLLLSRKPKPKKQPLIVTQTSSVVIPPWQKALEDLDALVGEDLCSKGQILLYHYRLSQILRVFLEANYAFPALENTTREIRIALQKRQLDSSGEIYKFLFHCDMVKFAKREVNNEDIELTTNWLRAYLQRFANNVEQNRA